MVEFNDHPQLAERDRWREDTTRTGATARALLPPSLPVGVEPQWGKVPALGEHTDAVLAEFSVTTA